MAAGNVQRDGTRGPPVFKACTQTLELCLAVKEYVNYSSRKDAGIREIVQGSGHIICI